MSKLEENQEIEREAVKLSKAFGQELDNLGVPFICIVGLPTGSTLRMSKQLDNPETAKDLVAEVLKYAAYSVSGGDKN